MKAAPLLATVVLALLVGAVPAQTRADEPAFLQVISHTRNEVVHVALLDEGGREIAADELPPGRSWSPRCCTLGATYVLRISAVTTSTIGKSIVHVSDKHFTVTDCPAGRGRLINVDVDPGYRVWITLLCREVPKHDFPLPLPRPS